MFSVKFMDINNSDFRFQVLHRYMYEKYVDCDGWDTAMIDPLIHQNMFFCEDATLYREMRYDYERSTENLMHPMFVPYRMGEDAPDTSASFINAAHVIGYDWMKSPFFNFYWCVASGHFQYSEAQKETKSKFFLQFFGSTVGRLICQYTKTPVEEHPDIDFQFIIVGRASDRDYYIDLVNQFTQSLNSSVGKNEIRFCV